MGVVYLARERASSRAVAIKLLQPLHASNPEATRRFTREARTAAALRHPRIVHTLAIEELAGDAVAIISEYVPGLTLRALLRRDAPLPFDQAAALLRDVASALAHAHQYGIVHRDVKPENIFVDSTHGHALLADFGIARRLDRALDGDSLVTAPETAFGTPAYMAPEQVAGGEVDERADVYALGLVGWEMLTGVRPWEGESLYSILHKQQHEQLPALADLVPEIPVYLLLAIEGAMAKRPEERWRDADVFLARLSPTPLTLPPRLAWNGDEPEGSDAATLPAWARSSAETSGEAADSEAESAPPAETAEPALADPSDDQPTAVAADEDRPSDASAVSGRRGRKLDRWPFAAGVAALLAVASMLAPRPRVAVADRAPPARASLSRVSGGDVAPADSVSLQVAAGDSAAPGTAGAMVPPAVTDSAVSSPERVGDARPEASARKVDAATSPSSSKAGVSRRRRVARSALAVRDPRCRSSRDGDQRACLLGHVREGDVRLNRTYQTLIARLRARAGGAAEPPAVRRLRAEQRAWLVRRDAVCRRRVSTANRPLWGLERAPCFAELSRWREDVLRTRLSATSQRR